MFGNEFDFGILLRPFLVSLKVETEDYDCIDMRKLMNKGHELFRKGPAQEDHTFKGLIDQCYDLRDTGGWGEGGKSFFKL